MLIPIDEQVFFDVTTHVASSGAVSDADSPPTYDVFEESTDVPVLDDQSMTKRTSLTGNYRGSFTASAANGFEAGKWYAVVVSATVSSVAAKAVAMHFRVAPAESTAGVPKADDINASAGDPWSVALPGAYAAGTAGYRVGTYLTAPVYVSASGTVTSGTSTYCTAAEAVLRLDARQLAEWLSDTTTALTSAQVLASATLAALLKGASGELEAACMVGERYTTADLTALINGTTNAGEMIKNIVAGLALQHLWARRVRTSGEPMPTLCQWAEAKLNQLRLGITIFGIVDHGDAGKLEHDEMDASQVRQRKLLSNVYDRFFGERAIERDPTP